MTKEELLEEANRRYPIGTKYIDIGNTAVGEQEAYKSARWLDGNIDVGLGYVYFNGKWAEIPGQTLKEFPSEGMCKTTDIRLAKYLVSRPYTKVLEGGLKREDAKIISWNSTSHWYVKTSSGKIEYTLEQLEPFLVAVNSEPEEPEYVECIKIWIGKGLSKTGRIYSVNIPNDFSKWTIKEIIKGKATTKNWKDFFKPSTKEAFEAQNTKNMEYTPKKGDYFVVNDNNSLKMMLMRYDHEYSTYLDSTRCRGPIISDYQTDQKTGDYTFEMSSGCCFKSNDRKARLATMEEVHWLNRCIEAKTFVPKASRVHIFNDIYVGDIVVRIDDNWNTCVIGSIVKADASSENGMLSIRSEHEKCKESTMGRFWRKATPEEIEAYNKGIRNIKDIVKAPKFEAGKWYNLKYSSSGKEWDVYFKVLKYDGNKVDFADGYYIDTNRKYAKANSIELKSILVRSIKEVDISEIQPYLPDGHIDKIKNIKMINGNYYVADNGNIFRWGNGDSDAYLRLTDGNKLFFKDEGSFTENIKTRSATPEEKQWLEACINANKFIPKEEALKPTFVYKFNVGDRVRVVECGYGVADIGKEVTIVERGEYCKEPGYKVSPPIGNSASGYNNGMIGEISFELIKQPKIMYKGRWLEALVDCPQGIARLNKGGYAQILEEPRKGSNTPVVLKNGETGYVFDFDEIGKTWKLMPEGWTPDSVQEDWCVKVTAENQSVVKDYFPQFNKKKENWSWMTNCYYGFKNGELFGTISNYWGKVLTTEEFYKRIGYPIPKNSIEKFKVGDWVILTPHMYSSSFYKEAEFYCEKYAPKTAFQIEELSSNGRVGQENMFIKINHWNLPIDCFRKALSHEIPIDYEQGPQETFKEGDLVIADHPSPYWWKKGEILKLGGQYWTNKNLADINSEIAAISKECPKGNGNSDQKGKNNVRHCTLEEAAYYNKVGPGANIYDMNKPDPFYDKIYDKKLVQEMVDYSNKYTEGSVEWLTEETRKRYCVGMEVDSLHKGYIGIIENVKEFAFTPNKNEIWLKAKHIDDGRPINSLVYKNGDWAKILSTPAFPNAQGWTKKYYAGVDPYEKKIEISITDVFKPKKSVKMSYFTEKMQTPRTLSKINKNKSIHI